MGGASERDQTSKSGTVNVEGPFHALTKITIWYVMMPAGIVGGALSRLGLIGVVVPEINNLPQCAYASALLLVSVYNELPSTPNRYISNKAAKTFVNEMSLQYVLMLTGRARVPLPLATMQLGILR